MSNAGYGNHDEAPPKERGGTLGNVKAEPVNPGDADAPAKPETSISTPGDGAGATAPVGDDVDPGVG